MDAETKRSTRIRLYDYSISGKGSIPYLVMKDEADNSEKIVCQLAVDEDGNGFWQILRINYVTFKEINLFVRTLQKAGIYKITKPNHY